MAGSKWWNSLSPAQKKAYIKTHPNSKYARSTFGAGAAGKKGINPMKLGLGLGVAGGATTALVKHADTVQNMAERAANATGKAVKDFWDHHSALMVDPSKGIDV